LARNKVHVEQTQIEYAGFFSRPAFALWGEGRTILEGLFTALDGFHTGLKDFRGIGEGANPSEQAVVVGLGANASYRFRFDRVEASAHNLGDDEISERLPMLLARGDSWLRSSVKDLAFAAHILTYSGHWTLEKATAREFLQNLSNLSLPSLGTNLGSGILFHGEIPERNLRANLTVDHSVVVQNALFVQYLILVNRDVLDYRAMFREGRTMLDAALERLDLELERA
jgi:hypothetical protein